MIDKYFVIFAIASCINVLICTSEGASETNEKTGPILLKDDSEICPSGKVFFDSRNAEACETVYIPAGNENMSEANVNQFLCLGLHSRVYTLCYLVTIKDLAVGVFPENATVFDAKVATNYPVNTTNALQFCQTWKPVYRPAVQPPSYVTELALALKDVSSCVKICADFHGHLQPLCAVLATVETIFTNKRTIAANNIDHSGKEGTPKDPKTTVQRAEVPSNKAVSPPNDKANVQKNSASGADRNVPPLAVQSQPVIVSGNPLSNKKPMSLEPRPASVGNAAQGVENDQQGAGKVADSSENKGGAKTKTADAPVEGNADGEQLKNHRNDDSKVDKDLPSLPLESPDDDTAKMPSPENKQPDDNVDVISEHTQNDDQAAVVRPPQEDGEIESSIISASEEDVNDIPAQASVKHGYVPGMRGIRNDDDSHVFGYFTVIGVICIAGYVGYHNKQKILAMMLEGRRSRGGRGRRRPSTANYRKLDCTLEEAVTSQCTSNVTHVIY